MTPKLTTDQRHALQRLVECVDRDGKISPSRMPNITNGMMLYLLLNDYLVEHRSNGVLAPVRYYTLTDRARVALAARS